MKQDVKTELSRKMKVRMFEMDMTIRALGRKSGVGERRVGNYIAMRNTMNADALAKIAEALEVSADWLLGLTDRKTRD